MTIGSDESLEDYEDRFQLSDKRARCTLDLESLKLVLLRGILEDLLTHHNIKHMTSTPYHLQANGKVEVTNRALEGIPTKVMSNNKKDWADRLVEATWAYNTTWKTTTRSTPYELVYGKKALLSIEFEFNTLRMAAQLDLVLSHVQKERLLQLNGLDEYRLQALHHIEVV